MELIPKKHHPSHVALSIIGIMFLGWYFLFVFIIHNIHDDGLVYAIIAKNMAQGLGSIWDPAYSPHQYHHFFEHPGLGLWMGSFFFKIFGNHLYTEKIFSCMIAGINLFYLFLYWKHYIAPNHKASVGWVVILSFSLIPLMVFYYPSNVLEMLANAFALPTIHLLQLSARPGIQSKALCYYQGLIALLLAIAFLINGPLTLFPLAFYLCHAIAFKQHSLKGYAKLSLSLWVMFGLCLGLFLLTFTGAYENMKQYFLSQLLPSLAYQRYDSTLKGLEKLKIIRSTIMQYTFCLLFLWLFYGLLPFLIGMKQTRKHLVQSLINPITYLFFFIGLAALLPIAISPKQSSRFALQACFFFNLTFLSFITGPIEEWVKSIPAKFIYLIGFGLFFLASYLFVSFPTQFKEDVNKYYAALTALISRAEYSQNFDDSEAIATMIKQKTNLLSVPDVFYRANPSIVGTYLNRRHDIYISPIGISDYLLISRAFMIKKSYEAEVKALLNNSDNYQLVQTLKLHKLYKRNPSVKHST